MTRDEFNAKYPEHAKAELFKGSKQDKLMLLSEFLDFLQQDMKFEMASYDHDRRIHNHAIPFDVIIAKFIDVDPVAFEREKDKMIKEMTIA